MIKFRSVLALIAIALASFGAPASVRADAATDDPARIQQAGNGAGESTPVISNFNARSVLFDKGNLGRGHAKYLAFGTVRNTDGSTQLAVTSGSDDGLRWSVPQRATLQAPGGQVLPFLMSPQSFFDVVFTTNNPAFTIYYEIAGADIFTIASMHFANSADGATWVENCQSTSGCVVGQNPANPVVSGAAGSFKRGSHGPTDVIFQATTAPGLCGPLKIWSCKYVMIYDTTDGTTDGLGIAGSIDGMTNFFGAATPLLSPGPGWDSAAATLGHLSQRGSVYVLSYAGASATGCAGVLGLCSSLGTATSGDGLTFTKSTFNPVTPAALFDSFEHHPLSALGNAQTVVDGRGGPHARVFFTRIDPAGYADTFAASTAAAPGTAPTVTIGSPTGIIGANAAPPFIAFATDTTGTNIGLDQRSLRMTLDAGTPAGRPLTGVSAPSIVTSYSAPSVKITAPTTSMSDGIHTLTVSATDLDGETTSLTQSFQVDTAPLTSTVTTTAPSPAIGFPFGLGLFRGIAADTSSPAGAPLLRMTATATDPLGNKKVFPGDGSSGFYVERYDATSWAWSWSGPALDLFFVIPGAYTVSFTAIDAAGNAEQPSEANTATVTVT